MADNRANLISLATRPEEERKEIARKGNAASVKVRRDKRNFRETFNAILSVMDKDKNGNPVINPVTGKQMSIRETIAMRAMLEAKEGNVKALQTILDVLGERTLKIDNTINGDMSADITIAHIISGHQPASSEAEIIQREGIEES